MDEAHDPYAALRLRDYRLLLTCSTLAGLGSQMQATAVEWELFQRTGRNAMIGTNATVLDQAEIGCESIVAAGALVPASFKVPERTLVGGIPAKLLRALDDADIARKSRGTRIYQDLAARMLLTLQRVPPLSAPEPGRRRVSQQNDDDLEPQAN